MAKNPDQLKLLVTLQRDGAAASVSVSADFDPALFDQTLVESYLTERSVEINDDVRARVAKLVADFQAEPREIQVEVARAAPAVDGEDEKLVWGEGFDPDEQDAAPDDPGADEASGDVDSTDFYNSVAYVRVKKGDRVATLRKPEDGGAGRDGKTVTGEVIKAKPGKTCGLEFDSSVRVGEDGGVVAQMDGVLVVTGRVVMISRLLEVGGYVDFETGNIDFDGAVQIKEGVRDKFEVAATQDIEVRGLVESATLRAGGNVVLGCGIAARGKGAALEVDGDVTAGFLNNVRGRVMGTLCVRRELISCNLLVGGELAAPSATLIGGAVSVCGAIEIGTLGSESNTPTALCTGDSPVLREHAERISAATADIEARLAELADELDAAQKGKGAKAKERVVELMYETDSLTRLRKRCQETRERALTTASSVSLVDITVRKILYPRVTLQLGAVSATFTKPVKGPVRFLMESPGRPVYRVCDGPPRNLANIAEISVDQEADERHAA